MILIPDLSTRILICKSKVDFGLLKIFFENYTTERIARGPIDNKRQITGIYCITERRVSTTSAYTPGENLFLSSRTFEIPKWISCHPNRKPWV